MCADVLSFVPTKSSSRLNADNNYKTSVFTSYKGKRTVKTANRLSEDKPDTSEQTLNMKRLKQEVIRFGMSGFTPKDEKAAKIQLAVKLGAKPPKNKYVNYKTLQEEKKRAQKKSLKEQQQFELRTRVKPNIGRKNRQKKGVKSNILDVYGKVRKKDALKSD